MVKMKYSETKKKIKFKYQMCKNIVLTWGRVMYGVVDPVSKMGTSITSFS